MKKALGLFIFIIVSKVCLSTGQIPDYMIYNNDTIPIFSNPLEQYFEKTGKRNIIELKNNSIGTDCWRGYKAIWKLKSDSLFLVAITGCHYAKDCLDPNNADLQKMFGDEYKKGHVFASWFSGEIIAPKGKLIQYVHMGYASIYEEEQYFRFKNGILRKIKTKSNKKLAVKKNNNKKEVELANIVLDTVFELVKKNVNWDTTLTPYIWLCDDDYILRYGRQGKLKKVKVDWYPETFFERIGEWWWNIIDDRKCRKTIKKALKSYRIPTDDLPKKRREIRLDILYDRKKGELELMKKMW